MSISDAQALNELAQRINELKFSGRWPVECSDGPGGVSYGLGAGAMTPNVTGVFFPAKITASLAEDYSFTEQEFQPDGTFIDLAGGRTGVYNGLHPAHELNQTTGVANGTIVWMTEGDDNPNPAIGQEYEFAFPVGTGGLAKWIIFTLTATLTVTSATQSVNVVNYWQGTNPGATVTVHNMPANVNYVFSGSTGFYGMAVYDDVANFYRIVQMQC